MATKKSAKTTISAPSSVRVRNAREVVDRINALIEYALCERISKKLSVKNQRRIVSYGPWIASLLLLFILPQLLIFAKDATFVGVSTFFTAIFFNQASWVLMLVVLANCLLLADGLSDIFTKKRRGWNRIYIAFLINLAYIFTQLTQNITQPAAPIISLGLTTFFLSIHFNIKKYYK